MSSESSKHIIVFPIVFVDRGWWRLLLEQDLSVQWTCGVQFQPWADTFVVEDVVFMARQAHDERILICATGANMSVKYAVVRRGQRTVEEGFGANGTGVRLLQLGLGHALQFVEETVRNALELPRRHLGFRHEALEHLLQQALLRGLQRGGIVVAVAAAGIHVSQHESVGVGQEAVGGGDIAGRRDRVGIVRCVGAGGVDLAQA